MAVVLYVLFGGDLLAIRKRVNEIREEADGGTGMLDTNLTSLDGPEASAEAILAAAMAVPFLAPRRVVIANGILDRFSGRQRSGSSGEPAGGSGSSRGRGVGALQPLLDVLQKEELPPSTDLILTGLTAERADRNPLLRRLRKLPGAVIEELKPPQRRELSRFIRDEGTARGIRWQSGGSRTPGVDPVARLAERMQADTLAIAGELDKLALYTLGREATADDVDAVCSGEKETTTFNLVDAVMDGQDEQAMQYLASLRSHGTSMQALMGLIAGSYRRLAIIHDHLEAGATADEVGQAIGLPWPNLRDRAIARARRHGMDGIREAFRLIVDADRRMKLGEVEEDLTMEVLLFSLAAIAPAARNRRRQATGGPPR